MCVRSRLLSVEWYVESSLPAPGLHASVETRQGLRHLPSSCFLCTVTACSAHGLRICCTPLPAMDFATFQSLPDHQAVLLMMMILRDSFPQRSTLRSVPLTKQHVLCHHNPLPSCRSVRPPVPFFKSSCCQVFLFPGPFFCVPPLLVSHRSSRPKSVGIVPGRDCIQVHIQDPQLVNPSSPMCSLRTRFLRCVFGASFSRFMTWCCHHAALQARTLRQPTSRHCSAGESVASCFCFQKPAPVAPLGFL